MPERRTDQEVGETTLTGRENKPIAGYVAGGRDGARVAVDQGGSPGSASNTTRSARFTTAAKAPRLRGDESTVSRILASTFGCSASKISRKKVSSILLYSPLFTFITFGGMVGPPTIIAPCKPFRRCWPLPDRLHNRNSLGYAASSSNPRRSASSAHIRGLFRESLKHLAYLILRVDHAGQYRVVVKQL